MVASRINGPATLTVGAHVSVYF